MKYIYLLFFTMSLVGCSVSNNSGRSAAPLPDIHGNGEMKIGGARFTPRSNYSAFDTYAGKTQVFAVISNQFNNKTCDGATGYTPGSLEVMFYAPAEVGTYYRSQPTVPYSEVSVHNGKENISAKDYAIQIQSMDANVIKGHLRAEFNATTSVDFDFVIQNCAER
jgi:hypothetical protein